MILNNCFKLCIILIISLVVNSWKTSNLLSNFSNLVNSTDFRQKLVKKTALNDTSHLIFFGGYIFNETNNSKALSNSLYKINLSTQQATELAVNKIVKPSNRYSVCGAIVRDRLFIYGGYTQGDLLSNELWQYGFLTDEWAFRGRSLNFSSCDLMQITNTQANDTVAITGLLQSTSKLQIVQYLVFNQTFITDIKISNYNSIKLNSTLWDGSSQISYLRIDTTEDIIEPNYSVNADIQFPIKYFCVIGSTPNRYLIITNNGWYNLTKVGPTYEIKFWTDHSQQDYQKILCLNVDSWYFFVFKTPSEYKDQYNIQIEYLEANTSTIGLIYKNKRNFYVQWLDRMKFYSSFTYNQSIFIINEKMQVFYLNQTCDSEMLSNVNVQQCAFGLFSCVEGFTGTKCDIPQCPGSLKIYNAFKLTIIDIVCSGNGECTLKGCKCFTNWGGQSCQIYQKSNCQGTLLQNYIASNCQCNVANIGGNECNVVFCYNDCSGKGVCQKNGQCLCSQDYTGPDCSILKITFDIM